MSQRIFISYRRADSAGYVRALHDRLQQSLPAHTFYFDLESIGAGEDFARSIREAIEASAVVLVVIGPDWLEAGPDGRRRIDDPEDLVRVEVRTALERGGRVVPVLVGGAELPAVDDLPADLRPLLSLNAVEITNASFNAATTRLAGMLRGKAVARRAAVASALTVVSAVAAAVMIAQGTPGPYYFGALGLLALFSAGSSWVAMRAAGVRLAGRFEVAVPFVLFAGLTSAGLTLHSEARAGTPFSVTVRVTEGGRAPDPMPAGTVLLDSRAGSRSEALQTDGEAVFTGLPSQLAGDTVTVTIRAERYEASVRSGITIAPNRLIEIPIFPEEVATDVRGTVLDAARLPVANAVVNFGSGLAVDTTDAGGNFRVIVPERSGTVTPLLVTVGGLTRYNDLVTLPESAPLQVILRSPPDG